MAANPDVGAMSQALGPIVDVHAHAFMPSWLKAFKASAGGAPGDNAGRLPPWSVEAHLALMDRQGIATAILSWPGATSFLSGADARSLARAMNEEMADIMNRFPGRFGAFGAAPMDDIDAAIEETAYALDVLKLDGMAGTTNVDGRYLGHPHFEPWLEALNKRSAVLFVHPTTPAGFDPAVLGMNVAVIEFMFETTRMVSNLVFSGAKARHPDVKVIATHGGGAAPYLSGRISTLGAALSDLGGATRNREPWKPAEILAGLRSFYFDLTASTWPASVASMREFVPADRLMMGFDFPMMREELIGPAKENLARTTAFSPDDKTAITSGNALRLFPRFRAALD